jgi:hypothetical protein
MSRETVEGTFAAAQSAIEQGDWETFFACLDNRSLLKIAKNSLQGILNSDTSQAILNEYGVAIASIQPLRAKVQSLAASAAVVVATTDPALRMQQSLHHKQLVDEYDQSLEDLLKAVADLPGFTAALERAMRALVGGGSVASDMFMGESLQDISIEGKTAWGVRRTSRGDCQDLKFVQRRGRWYIQLLARGRRRG